MNFLLKTPRKIKIRVTELQTEAKLASGKKRSASLEDFPYLNDPSMTQHLTDDASNEYTSIKTTEPNIASNLTNLKLNGKTPFNEYYAVAQLIHACRPPSEPVWSKSRRTSSSLINLEMNDKPPVNNCAVAQLILALRPLSEPVCNRSNRQYNSKLTYKPQTTDKKINLTETPQSPNSLPIHSTYSYSLKHLPSSEHSPSPVMPRIAWRTPRTLGPMPGPSRPQQPIPLTLAAKPISPY